MAFVLEEAGCDVVVELTLLVGPEVKEEELEIKELGMLDVELVEVD